jgi:hypothetical protein
MSDQVLIWKDARVFAARNWQRLVGTDSRRNGVAFNCGPAHFCYDCALTNRILLVRHLGSVNHQIGIV